MRMFLLALSLLREFRIFTASNAAAFVLLALTASLRNRSPLELMLAALVLMGAATATAAIYLFNQNWLHMIIFGAYVGMAYCAYLAGVALLFTDILLNRARMTSLAVQALSATTVAIPC